MPKMSIPILRREISEVVAVMGDPTNLAQGDATAFAVALAARVSLVVKAKGIKRIHFMGAVKSGTTKRYKFKNWKMFHGQKIDFYLQKNEFLWDFYAHSGSTVAHPILACESEMFKSQRVSLEYADGYYAWDFSKLLHSRADCTKLFICRTVEESESKWLNKEKKKRSKCLLSTLKKVAAESAVDDGVGVILFSSLRRQTWVTVALLDNGEWTDECYEVSSLMATKKSA